MKRLILLAGFLILAANPSPVAAQKSQALEFSGFGSWWRFDRSFLLENQFGGGARVGYNLSDRVGLEVVGDFVQTRNLAQTQNVKVQTISANLVLNFPVSDRFTVAASGGYSNMVFGPDAPYDFTQHLIGGGLGFRGFISRKVAIRGDVRAQYRPDNPFFNNAFTGQVQACRRRREKAGTRTINGTGALRVAPSCQRPIPKPTRTIQWSAATG